MRVVENPGRSFELENGSRSTVTLMRESPFVVAIGVATRRNPGATATLEEQEGLALLHGLAAMYDCRVVEN